MRTPRAAPLTHCLAILVALVAAAPAWAGPQVFEGVRQQMGTVVRISVWTDREEAARAAVDAAFAEIDRIDRLFSTYKPGSAISRINADAGTKPVKVPREVFDRIAQSIEAGRRSGGAFDITYKGLGLWRFGETPSVPEESEIKKRLRRVDYRNVLLDEAALTVRFKSEGMAIGLGGMAKGYAVDRAAAVLKEAGFDDYIVNAGGDMLVSGSKGGDPWRVGIQDPRKKRGELMAVIEGADGAVVTSGDYERFFVKDGKRYHHIIDPRTGRPARGCRSVTVVAADAETADWMSTAVFVLGPAKGMALIEKTPGAECLIVDANGARHASSRLESAVVIRYR